LKWVAEAIGRQIGVPTKSLTPEQATTHFGGLAMWLTGSGAVASERTRKVRGWEPTEIGLIPDIDRSEYYS
jgi:hypothetical protein